MMSCPDLRPHFKHAISRPMPHSFGVPVLSDWADKAADDPVFGIYKQCGFWTRDEAAILYEAARRLNAMEELPSNWLDIGGHTGWTAVHLAVTGAMVDSLDPMYQNEEFRARANANIMSVRRCAIYLYDLTSDEFFGALDRDIGYNGVVIDGDHERPHPLHDAQNTAKHLLTPGCIFLHDAIGAPVQEAVEWLVETGFSCKVYLTPNVVACCWRGEFTPPGYEPDENVKRGLQARLPGWMLECA